MKNLHSGTGKLSAAGLIGLLITSALVLLPGTSMADGRFNVRGYGAVGDGKTLDSPAINKAILACAAAGGGTVYLPAGTYLSGSIRLTNNINLFIDAGAVILAAPIRMKAYDETEPWEEVAYQDGGHTFFHNSLIWGENLVNVSITGRGMINGRGLPDEGGGLVAGDAQEDARSGFKNWQKATPGNDHGGTPDRNGNKAIALKLCRNVLVRDITIYHGGHFAILVTGCDNLTIDNVTIDTNRDGIDLDCCRNTMVSNCRINSPSDDALCPKSIYALGRNVITENMTIVNCLVSGFQEGTLLDGTLEPRGNGNGRIKFGTEANGGFRNITIANCTFRACRGLALEEVDGGIMENISIENITMMDVPACGIYITTGKRNRGPNVTVPSRMRNIRISNVVASGVSANAGIEIFGLPEQPIENLRLENIRMVCEGGGTRVQTDSMPRELGTGYPEPLGVMPAYGVFARHVKSLELANMSFSLGKDDLRPALVCTDIDGLEVDNFKAQLGQGVAAAKLSDDVKNVVIRNSPLLQRIATQSR
jgi:polygalacturonase